MDRGKYLERRRHGVGKGTTRAGMYSLGPILHSTQGGAAVSGAERVPNEAGLYYESAEEIEAGLVAARERGRLLRWVRRHAKTALTAKQRRLVMGYYFDGRTMREVAEAAGVHASTVLRGLRASIKKLRKAAEAEGMREAAKGLEAQARRHSPALAVTETGNRVRGRGRVRCCKAPAGWVPPVFFVPSATSERVSGFGSRVSEPRTHDSEPRTHNPECRTQNPLPPRNPKPETRDPHQPGVSAA